MVYKSGAGKKGELADPSEEGGDPMTAGNFGGQKTRWGAMFGYGKIPQTPSDTPPKILNLINGQWRAPHKGELATMKSPALLLCTTVCLGKRAGA